jgi:prepilin-type N-terminal cleavage/methylation domain-containing protein
MPLTRHRGFTLIELMVSLVLGMVVIGGVMGVFISTYQANAQNIKAIRLNEEMRAVMSMITRDVRRAGARGFAWNSSTVNWYATNPLSTAVAWAVSNTPAGNNSCLRFAYAVSASASNYVGYRLVTDNGKPVIKMYASSSASNWKCDGNNWQPVTDPEIAWIQSLVFTATTEPGVTGVAVRTVTVNLRAATHTRSTDPSTQTANCNDIDVVCRQLVEKIRVRNDAVL